VPASAHPAHSDAASRALIILSRLPRGRAMRAVFYRGISRITRDRTWIFCASCVARSSAKPKSILDLRRLSMARSASAP